MFKYAKARGKLFDGLLRALTHAAQSGVPFEAWVDGSFLTQKLNPKDADVVLRIQYTDWDRASKQQRGMIEWIGSVECKLECYCKGYYFLDCEGSHPRAAIAEADRKMWVDDFAYATYTKEPKGVAVLAF